MSWYEYLIAIIVSGAIVLGTFIGAVTIFAPSAAQAQGGLGPGCNECINDTYELVYEGNLFVYGFTEDEDAPVLGAWLELDIQQVHELTGAGILTWKVDRIIERRDNEVTPHLISRRVQLVPQT